MSRMGLRVLAWVPGAGRGSDVSSGVFVTEMMGSSCVRCTYERKPSPYRHTY
jgi:hypothetical protein